MHLNTFLAEVVSSFGMPVHLLRENPFDMLAGIASSSPPSPSAAASDRPLHLANRVEITCLAIPSWRTSINFLDRTTLLLAPSTLLSLFFAPVAGFWDAAECAENGENSSISRAKSSCVVRSCTEVHLADYGITCTCPSQKRKEGSKNTDDRAIHG